MTGGAVMVGGEVMTGGAVIVGGGWITGTTGGVVMTELFVGPV